MCLPNKNYVFKVEREWEHAGLQCAVVQAKEGGHRCGYVRVPPGHPLYGHDLSIDFDIKHDLNVHGGVTFAKLEPCAHVDGVGWWLGFDCAHAFDAFYDPDNLPFQEIEFREKHGYPSRPNAEHFWTQPEVERETEQFAEQLAAMGAQ